MGVFETIRLNIIFPHGKKHYVTIYLACARSTMHKGFGRGQVAEDNGNMTNGS
jgi:hypothetical protein